MLHTYPLNITKAIGASVVLFLASGTNIQPMIGVDCEPQSPAVQWLTPHSNSTPNSLWLNLRYCLRYALNGLRELITMEYDRAYHFTGKRHQFRHVSV